KPLRLDEALALPGGEHRDPGLRRLPRDAIRRLRRPQSEDRGADRGQAPARHPHPHRQGAARPRQPPQALRGMRHRLLFALPLLCAFTSASASEDAASAPDAEPCAEIRRAIEKRQDYLRRLAAERDAFAWVENAEDAQALRQLMSLQRCAEHPDDEDRSEEHTSELQSRENLVCRLLLE